MRVLTLLVALLLDRGLVPRWAGARAIRWASDAEVRAGRPYTVRVLDRGPVTLEVGAWRWEGDGPATVRAPVPDRPWSDIAIRLTAGRRSSTLWTIIVP